jgi:hypothetical protein
VQESSESGSGSNAESVQVKEKNVSGSATSFALNLGGDDDVGDDATGEGDAGSSNAPSPSPISAAPAYIESAGNADAAESSGGTTEQAAGPLSFSSSSFNRHQKTTLYATQSSQQSASSQSSSSTNADIEDSSSGSTSLSFSINGFEYETTSGSKSEFSYLSEWQSSSDSPVGYDGRPSTHSEATSSHVIETLEESERTFGFGLGSDGLNVTNKYSSNDTVSDVLKSESTSGSWRLVYPTITSSLEMMTNPQSAAPYWVAGPDLEMTSGHNSQFNYGGNLEDGFEGTYSETTGFSQEFLNQEGTVYRYEYTLTVQETFPNTNDGDNAESNEQSGTTAGSGSGTTAFADGATQSENGSVAGGGSTVPVPPIVNSPTPYSLLGIGPWYFRSQTRSQILEGIPIITRGQIPNSLPQGMADSGQGIKSCWSGSIPTGTAVGPFGMGTCVGLVLRPLNLAGNFHSYHFAEPDDIEAGLIQTGALEYRLQYASRPEFENTLMPAEPFIAYLAGGSELNKLRETIDILKSHGIKIGGYLPCGDFRIDANGQLYWTHIGTNSTAEFEQ